VIETKKVLMLYVFEKNPKKNSSVFRGHLLSMNSFLEKRMRDLTPVRRHKISHSQSIGVRTLPSYTLCDVWMGRFMI